METGSLGSRTGNRRVNLERPAVWTDRRMQRPPVMAEGPRAQTQRLPWTPVPQMHGCPQTLLEDAGKALDFGLGPDCLALTPAKAPTASTSERGHIKASVSSAQHRKQPREGTWGVRHNVCKPHSNEERMSKTYEELTQLNSEKANLLTRFENGQRF